MLTQYEINELMLHTIRVAPRYGFTPDNIKYLITEHTAAMFLIIGLENRMMCKAARSNLFVAKIGVNKLLRSIHHRIFRSSITNLLQDFYTKELITLDTLIFELIGVDMWGMHEVTQWSELLDCITFINIENSRFKVPIGMTVDDTGKPNKYHWLSIEVDEDGHQTESSKNFLNKLGYKLISK